MEKELYYTNNKLISKLNIYFDNFCVLLNLRYNEQIYRINLTCQFYLMYRVS